MEFVINCGRTTLQDGTTLQNTERAPRFVIEGLEARTGISRPPEAERYTLEALELYFTSGGVLLADAKSLLPPAEQRS
ncbi:hypothetical protein AB1Y20_016733 [Prymnesium parvum]|uniref:Phosphoribosylaminoimidazolesuccinocarboxamide synthase n=1 Tax=Prymnesium parvum TaxID=97485 RepID=A0AB34ICP9_PRYPA